MEQENHRKRHIGVENDHSEELEWETQKFFRYNNIIEYFSNLIATTFLITLFFMILEMNGSEKFLLINRI